MATKKIRLKNENGDYLYPQTLAELVDDTSSTKKMVTEAEKTTWNGKSTVSGTNDGTNWQTITIDGTTKNIPAGGSGGGGTWGSITGTLSDQTDLQAALDGKSTVSASNIGTSTDEVKYITIDGQEKKLVAPPEGGIALCPEIDYTKPVQMTTYNYETYPNSARFIQANDYIFMIRNYYNSISSQASSDKILYTKDFNEFTKIDFDSYINISNIFYNNNTYYMLSLPSSGTCNLYSSTDLSTWTTTDITSGIPSNMRNSLWNTLYKKDSTFYFITKPAGYGSYIYVYKSSNLTTWSYVTELYTSVYFDRIETDGSTYVLAGGSYRGQSTQICYSTDLETWTVQKVSTTFPQYSLTYLTNKEKWICAYPYNSYTTKIYTIDTFDPTFTEWTVTNAAGYYGRQFTNAIETSNGKVILFSSDYYDDDGQAMFLLSDDLVTWSALQGNDSHYAVPRAYICNNLFLTSDGCIYAPDSKNYGPNNLYINIICLINKIQSKDVPCENKLYATLDRYNTLTASPYTPLAPTENGSPGTYGKHVQYSAYNHVHPKDPFAMEVQKDYSHLKKMSNTSICRAYYNHKHLLGYSDTTKLYFTSDYNNNMYYSDDGMTWTKSGSTIEDYYYKAFVSFGNNINLAVPTMSGTYAYTSTDCKTWTKNSEALTITGEVYAVEVCNDKLYIFSYYNNTVYYLYTSDGITWNSGSISDATVYYDTGYAGFTNGYFWYKTSNTQYKYVAVNNDGTLGSSFTTGTNDIGASIHYNTIDNKYYSFTKISNSGNTYYLNYVYGDSIDTISTSGSSVINHKYSSYGTTNEGQQTTILDYNGTKYIYFHYGALLYVIKTTDFINFNGYKISSSNGFGNYRAVTFIKDEIYTDAHEYYKENELYFNKTSIGKLPSISGTNDGTNWQTITINGTTKNIPSGGGGGSSTWGSITGTLSNQTDLQEALDAKSVVSGTNDGTNWQTITINGTTKNIPAGGSGVSSFDDLNNRPSYNNTAMTSSTNIPEVKTDAWDAKSVVSGTNDGTNWQTITIDGTTKNIPAGGGTNLPAYPTFDNTKQYVLGLKPNQAGTAWELTWVEDTFIRS